MRIKEQLVKRIVAIIILTGLCYSLGSAADLFAQGSIYTWTDENGVVHISNRKPGKDVNVQDVEHYNAPKGGSAERKSQNSVNVVEPTESQKQIEDYEKAAGKAEKKAEEARTFAKKAIKTANEFRDKISSRKKLWRKNRSKMKKLDEQAKLAGERARTATENARAAREAADISKQEKQAEATGKRQP